MAELASANMEGGSPRAIWQNWTLPLYFEQRRYWQDHPRLESIAAWYFKIKPRRRRG